MTNWPATILCAIASGIVIDWMCKKHGVKEMTYGTMLSTILWSAGILFLLRMVVS